MLKIGIIPNEDKDEDLKYTRILIDSIRKYGGTAFICDDIASKVGDEKLNITEDNIVDMSDIMVCLGGDGTFLRAARTIVAKRKPLLGVNLGKLGFLADVDKNDIENAVKHLVEGKFTIDERMMLDTVIVRDGKVVAEDIVLNDVVISRGAISRILHLKTYINDAFMDLYPGDGLIISTPTGSTAYSLSAGGPLVEPDVDLIICTPICPHLLYSRSFITTADREIKVVVAENRSHEAMVTVDGQNGYEVRGGDLIITKKSRIRMPMVRLDEKNFFDVLRGKIYDRGESMK
ncbi:MAG TPA: NAD(+)/NADH kinase [Acetivibrio sp.]|uniref:NAD(+)/NADH kinase n=1 Tax=Acetivibrio sp. TaxID=1872092 RepID=UPI002BF62565|nr:NAD(+)/NADH kinase [Acetivibrio sp.]HOM01362.1 NAD(+)/NADH kinase [Acetivibrio sp.]